MQSTKSLSQIRADENRQLAKQGKPYRYDAAGFRICATCGWSWFLEPPEEEYSKAVMCKCPRS